MIKRIKSMFCNHNFKLLYCGLGKSAGKYIFYCKTCKCYYIYDKNRDKIIYKRLKTIEKYLKTCNYCKAVEVEDE